MNLKSSYYNLAQAPVKKKIFSQVVFNDIKDAENFKSFEESGANVNKKMSVDNSYKSSQNYMKAKEAVNNKENIYKPKGGINF